MYSDFDDLVCSWLQGSIDSMTHYYLWFVHSTVGFCIPVIDSLKKLFRFSTEYFFGLGAALPNIGQPRVTRRIRFTLLLRKKWRSWSSWSGLVAIHCLLAASIVSWRWLTRLVAVPQTRTNRNSPWGWVAASHPLEWRTVVPHWVDLAPRGFSHFFI